jgi:FeS assembly protein IscX
MQTSERKELLNAVTGNRNVSSVDVREIHFAPGQETGRHLHPCTVVGYIAAGTAEYQTAIKEQTMPREIHWTDSEEIGIQLQEKFPDVDPLTVRFTDLHKYVTELEGFADDPAKSNESRLEAIQMAWHEEFEDAKG